MNKNYLIIKQALEKDVTNFVLNYFMIKRQVASTLKENKYISKFNEDWGTWSDSQVPNTYSHYADIVMETLLIKLHSKMEKETGLKLHPTYSFFRIYSFNADLKKHVDRESCEISVTVMIGSDGTEWPIYMNDKPVELMPGDACIYMGREVKHYRKNFKGDWHSQVFLHYVDQEGPFKDFKYDKRSITPET